MAMLASGNATFSFGGFKLPVINEATRGWIDSQIPWRDFVPFGDEPYSVNDLAHLDLPNPWTMVHEPRMGEVRWPTHASRWATAYLPIDEFSLILLRALSSFSGQYEPQWLVMNDNTTGYTVSALMHALPPRKLLVGVPKTVHGELWVLPLVDQRFFLWQRPVSFAQGEVPETWDDFFAALGTQMGVTIFLPAAPIPAEYLQPTPERWVCNNVPGCLILDAAAESIGMRVTVGFDGTIQLQQWTDAYTTGRDLFDTFTAEYASGVGLPDREGLGRVMGGGRMNRNDIAITTPGSVVVVFGRKEASGGDPLFNQWYSVTRNLGAYTGAAPPGGLTLSAEFGANASGILGNVARVTADAYALGPSGTPTNLADLEALATNAAWDWYGWQMAEHDVELAGILPWEFDGYSTVRWTYEEERVSTRVCRQPYFDPNVYGSYPTPAGGDSSILVLLCHKDWETEPPGATPIWNFRKYTGVEVMARDDANVLGPLTYEVRPGGRTFTVSGTPLYHERNLDLPVVGLDEGALLISGVVIPNFVHELSVVRVRQNPDGFWFFQNHPWTDLARLTEDSDADGIIAYHRYNRSNTPGTANIVWEDGIELRFIEAE